MKSNYIQKRKLLALREIISRYTDYEHKVTMKFLIERLKDYGIDAERKSIYQDIEVLKLFGMKIEQIRGKGYGYYLAESDFELAELQLLSDAVAESCFITSSKTSQLIEKLGLLCSVHQRKKLKNSLKVNDKIKSMNESIYYNVDTINYAISENRKISFIYFDYDIKKGKIYHNSKNRYLVSPHALICDDRKYYLVGLDEQAQKQKYFRLDKMERLFAHEDSRSEISEHELNTISKLSEINFGMFHGEPTRIRLHCAAYLAGVIIERFGNEVQMVPIGDGFDVNLTVAVSPLFFGWLFGFCGNIRIVYPESLKIEYENMLRSALNLI